MPKVKRDPANYREMLEPHESAEDADEALSAFFGAVSDLRKEHRIPNVLIVADIAYMRGGEEVPGRLCLNFGDQHHAYPLAAFAYGYEKARAAEFIAETERLAALSRKAPK